MRNTYIVPPGDVIWTQIASERNGGFPYILFRRDHNVLACAEFAEIDGAYICNAEKCAVLPTSVQACFTLPNSEVEALILNSGAARK